MMWQAKISFHYHSAFGHQTFLDDELPQAASTHKVTWPFADVVLLDHMKTKTIISAACKR